MKLLYPPPVQDACQYATNTQVTASAAAAGRQARLGDPALQDGSGSGSGSGQATIDQSTTASSSVIRLLQ
jgi:hypothetical protein